MNETKRERYIRILSGLGGAYISAEACKELVELLKEQPEIDEILNYLDTVLHPLVSPEHWNVYATLYDMISLLHFK